MSTPSGPVSAFLEQKLLATLNDKKLVLWLDAEGTYTAFVDELRKRLEARRFPVPVLAFRGSFLELMLALENEGTPLDKPLLLVHVPGYNNLPSQQSPSSVRGTPLLELYSSAHLFQQNLVSLVSDAANGRRPLADIEAFVAAPGLSLASADAWLADSGAPAVDTHAESISRLSAPELVNRLTGTDAANLQEVQSALRAHAETLFGTDAEWFKFVPELTEGVIAWILCVEFVHDLRRPPRHPALARLKDLPEKTVQRCQQEAARLRQQQQEQYRTWALGVESWLRDPENTEPKDLGRIDTFQFEALTIYRGAVQALADGDYAQALRWVEAHEASQGFWVRQEVPRQWAWTLVGDAARLGVALQGAPRPLERVTGLEEAVQCYTEAAAPVDLAHRHFEQRHAALYGPLLPELTALDQAFERLRFAWADWANQLARDFARVCHEHGALPPPELRQRNLFDQAVLPLLGQDEKVALFLLDALRFEMALELRDELLGGGVQVDLRARLAELPTVTSVGMNVLAPIERDGRLTPILKDGRFTGFRTRESSVTRPDDRVKAMGTRLAGKDPVHLSLAEVGELSAATLKNKVRRASLVVVHGTEIDQAGESDFGVRIFGSLIRDIAAARHQLELAGVQQFVFTSDHGFLLQRGVRTQQGFGSRGQADRRYVLSDTERTDTGHLCVPLSALHYEAPGFLVFREDTAEYDAGRPPGSFTHGGNSLQERVIPVLHVSRKRAAADTGLRFALECEPASAAMGVQRLKVRVVPARRSGQAPLDFASSQPVDVMMRVADGSDVRMVVKDVVGAEAVVQPTGFRLRPGTGEWAEVYFVLEGAVNDRLPIELALSGDPAMKVSPATTYPVSYVPVARKEPEAREPVAEAAPAPAPVVPPAPPPRTAGGWGETLGDPDAGRVFDHLQQFGSVNEAELVQLLGHPRKARAFAARFDTFRDKLTFDVQVVITADGKRYQRL
ncbi:BREX-6 system phosphatase PglZ [Pyxidicoccus fallax]|uniref:BREX-6 system phosphatase PglZ n=1 Tax=Pyxidicoccus fallax TaxID=394095 RepID=A0A848LPK8_9BACT|nr:BREX-6 system phosphatase PglZ [Pyxidicoccus fallax]NMO19434.1 BREX-6 system phosphatase PglZ [Pyxidicoccus fallax]NPC81572.1 BREX-6 system phosphatase PglZ [Pyxidicoccus fallax]